VRPSPENDELYHPPSPSDPAIIALAKSIRSRGVREPLVVTQDKWILSGHRRHYAAKLAGLRTVPCRIVPFRRDEDVKKFVRELAEYNQQRVKTFDEVVREEIVSTNPEQSYAALIAHRKERSRIDEDTIEIEGTKRRAKISAAKQLFLDAVRAVLDERRDFWPLTARQIHYALL